MKDEERQNLRRQSEDKLDRLLEGLEEDLDHESQQLLHELKIHQIDLEMQNKELHCTQEELIRIRDRYQDLFHNSPVGLLTLDQKGLIVEANKTISKQLDIPRQYLLGVPFRARVSERDKQIFDRLLQLCSRQGTTAGKHPAIELQLRRQDGSLLEVQLEGFTVEAGEGQELLLSVQDITEQKRLEKMELRRQKLESLGQLAGGIANDFNNLLTAIMGNINLARLNLPPKDTISDNLERAEKGILLARELTKQLFTFARGSSPVRRPVALAGLVQDTAILPQNETYHHFDYDFPGDLWPVSADAGQLVQVVHNLAYYAVHAMPGGGKVEIWASNVELGADSGLGLAPGRYVRLALRDHGPGIAPEKLEKIFDPYFMTGEAGTGLGLAVSRSIVEAHSGRLTISSTMGQGTLFEIYLPAAAEREMAPPPPSVELFKGSGRVLVMDDEEDILELASAMLRYLGYEPDTAADGRAALELYRLAQSEGKPFRTVILDLLVKRGMGGEETVAELHKLDPRLKAVVSSGYSDTSVAQNYRLHGFSGSIPKPYRIEELSRVLHEVLTVE